MRTLLIAALASFAATALLPASAGAQESACSVYCEQIPSGGGTGSNNGSTIPSEVATGTDSTVDRFAAGGATEQGTAVGHAGDDAQAEDRQRQVGDDSSREAQDDVVEEIASVDDSSGGGDGGSGVGNGLPILLALLLAGALGIGFARRTSSLIGN